MAVWASVWHWSSQLPCAMVALFIAKTCPRAGLVLYLSCLWAGLPRHVPHLGDGELGRCGINYGLLLSQLFHYLKKQRHPPWGDFYKPPSGGFFLAFLLLSQ
jgi:hypothetical protein